MTRNQTKKTRTAPQRAAAMAASVAMALCGVVVTAAPAYAAEFTVNSTADSGPGTLRDAIMSANATDADDTIVIEVIGPVFPSTALPAITRSVSIVAPVGSGLDRFAIVDSDGHGLSIDGTGFADVEVSISNVVVSGSVGDGIHAENADVTLSNVLITGAMGVGFSGSGGSFNFTDVDVEQNTGAGIALGLAGTSATLNNVVVADSGGVGVDATLSAGAELSIHDSLVEDSDAAGVVVDAQNSTVTVGTTLIYRNHSDDPFPDTRCGGGLHADIESTTLTLFETEISRNEALNAGGACIASTDSVITLDEVRFEENWGVNTGGGLHLEVGSGPAPVTIRDSIVVENEAGLGAGVFIDTPGDQGAYGGIQILRTTFDDNEVADWAGAIGIRDAYPTGHAGVPSLLIRDSTISNNSSEGSAGGLGVLSTLSASAAAVPFIVVENSTFTGNSAGGTGGGSIEAAAVSSPDVHPVDVHILNSTVSGNDPGDQLGEVAIGGNAGLTLRNSIVSGNNAGVDLYSEALGGFTPSAQVDYSLVGSTVGSVVSAAFAGGVGNISSTTPGLGVLHVYGGPTLTMLPGDSSPALNAGDPAYTGLTSDQRGEARVSGGRIDMGAVEVQQGLAATGVDATGGLLGGLLLLLAGGVLLARSGRAAPFVAAVVSRRSLRDSSTT